MSLFYVGVLEREGFKTSFDVAKEMGKSHGAAVQMIRTRIIKAANKDWLHVESHTCKTAAARQVEYFTMTCEVFDLLLCAHAKSRARYANTTRLSSVTPEEERRAAEERESMMEAFSLGKQIVLQSLESRGALARGPFAPPVDYSDSRIRRKCVTRHFF